MLLAVDAGNTDTVFGWYQIDGPSGNPADKLLCHMRTATQKGRTADEIFITLSQFGRERGIDARGSIRAVVISSSAPDATRSLVEMSTRWLEVNPLVVAPGIRVGIPIRYDNPKEVGPDRIADAVAALALYGAPVIVVDFGTATTFDAISAAGEYLGGAIAPGIEVSQEALVARAGALRKVEIRAPKSAIGRSTVESMQSGLIYGVKGIVAQMVEEFEKEIGSATVVATGGLAQVVASYVPRLDAVEPWLTLYGLRLLWERNGSPSKS
jgi:type III pantothenate kinase